MKQSQAEFLSISLTSMMNEKGNNVTQEFIDYILPLCEGNDKVIEKNGIAMYADKNKF